MKTGLRNLMHLVLAAAATNAALACGGALATDVDDTEPSGSGTGTASGSSTSSTSSSGSSSSSSSSSSSGGSSSGSSSGGSSSGGSTSSSSGSSSGQVDGGTDAQIDAQPDAVLFEPCVNGQIDPDPKFCCAPGDQNCTPDNNTAECSLDCQQVCDQVSSSKQTGGFQSCYWSTDPNTNEAKITYLCGACGVGRIPDGTASCDRGTSVGERLAMQAYYEAVSVTAFRRLADVLVRENAPLSLVKRVRNAACDEERHADIFTKLAAAHGACVPALQAMGATDEDPTLLDLAIENAREGCVRETYGALVALHQAEHAEDAALRDAFASIAGDEITHAELSWDLAKFFESRLSAPEILAQRNAAMIHLREASTRDHDAVDAKLGIPSPRKARVMFDDLFGRLAA